MKLFGHIYGAIDRYPQKKMGLYQLKNFMTIFKTKSNKFISSKQKYQLLRRCG